MTVCRFRSCATVLPVDSGAAYCKSAHRSAEHRACRADEATTATARKADALAAVHLMTTAALVNDLDLVLTLALDIEDLLQP